MVETAPAAKNNTLYFWVLAALSAILLLAPIRQGDLPGYDDALYAHIAKGVVQSGDWPNLQSNGHPVLEHPPLLVWMEAALFSVFGFSDFLAKLPSALCGMGTILLVYWFARRLLGTRFAAIAAMFVMATSIYFLKYAARAMTDVPCTFCFIAAVCAWTKVAENRRWYLITGILCALALMSRGMIGLALPAIFALDLLVRRQRPPLGYAAAALLLAFLPITAWYWHTVSVNRDVFLNVHSTWLRNEVYGGLTPAWRRYTGAPEYLWMITKSYWPWLPAMVAGIVVVVRSRDRKLALLLIWTGVVFLLCAITRSRVLRYMLPAYPAFAILAALGITHFIRERYVYKTLSVLLPILAVVVFWVALFPPVIPHATEIRPIADAAAASTRPDQRVAFYDEGNSRFDIANQLHWYGSRNLQMLFTPEELRNELRAPSTDVFLLDRAAFHQYIENQRPYHLLQERGGLVLFRLS